jgi:hypothetical protein
MFPDVEDVPAPPRERTPRLAILFTWVALIGVGALFLAASGLLLSRVWDSRTSLIYMVFLVAGGILAILLLVGPVVAARALSTRMQEDGKEAEPRTLAAYRAAVVGWIVGERLRLLRVLLGGVTVGLMLVLANIFGVADTDPVEDFRVEVSTDRDVYSKDDPVRITTRVCSVRWWSRHTSESAVHWTIFDDDGEVAGSAFDGSNLLVYIPQTWGPRQCRTWEGEWDQRSQALAIDGPGQQTPAPAGEYRIRAQWDGVSLSQTPPFGRNRVMSAPFRIQPRG